MTGRERYWFRRARRRNGGMEPPVFSMPPTRAALGELRFLILSDEMGQVYRVVRCNESTRVHFRSPMETRT